MDSLDKTPNSSKQLSCVPFHFWLTPQATPSRLLPFSELVDKSFIDFIGSQTTTRRPPCTANLTLFLTRTDHNSITTKVFTLINSVRNLGFSNNSKIVRLINYGTCCWEVFEGRNHKVIGAGTAWTPRQFKPKSAIKGC